MKRLFIFMILILETIIFVGCASTDTTYKRAVRQNTIEAYENFIERYPESPYAKSAKERLTELKEIKIFREVEAKNLTAAYEEYVHKYPRSKYIEAARIRAVDSDSEAIKRTYRIGTTEAFQGFSESYPKSQYLPEVKARIGFLKAVQAIPKDARLDSYKNFIKRNPTNPYVGEAKATIPLLWMAEFGKVGVLINIGDLVSWKGLFKGGSTTKEEVCKKIFDGLKKELEKEGVRAVLIADKADPQLKNLPILITVLYKEVGSKSYNPPSSSQYPGPGLPNYAAQTLNKAAADMLTETLMHLFAGPNVSITSELSVADTGTNYEYYSKLQSLDQPASKPMVVKALSRLNLEQAIPSLLVATKDKDEQVRKATANALNNIKYTAETAALFQQLLNDESPYVRQEIVSALSRSGKPASEILNAVLEKDRDWDVRFEAACSLAVIGVKNKRQVDILLDALKKTSVEWKQPSTDNTAAKKTKVAVKAKSKSVDRSAISQISNIGTYGRKSHSMEIRMKAVDALMEIAAPRSIAALISVLDTDVEVGVKVFKALRKITGQEFEWEKGKWTKWWLKNLEDKRDVELLIETVKVNDLDMQIGAVEIIGNIQDANAVATLVDILFSSSSNIENKTLNRSIKASLVKIWDQPVKAGIPIKVIKHEKSYDEVFNELTRSLLTSGRKVQKVNREEGMLYLADCVILVNVVSDKETKVYVYNQERGEL